jgi:hypothetical protein
VCAVHIAGQGLSPRRTQIDPCFVERGALSFKKLRRSPVIVLHPWSHHFDERSPRQNIADFEIFFLRLRATLVPWMCIVPHFSGPVVWTFPAAPIAVGERMVRSSWSRSSRNGGVAIVALFAGFLLSPRVSEAGCGDHVSIRGGHVPMAHSMLDQSTDGSSADRADHSPPHRPCQGPGCSNGSVPPQAPTPWATVSIDRWALAPGDTFPNPVSCSNVLVEPLHLVTDGFRLSILRPPR